MKEQIDIIVNAIDVATRKGCYSLNETAIIVEALKKVFPTDEKKEDE